MHHKRFRWVPGLALTAVTTMLFMGLPVTDGVAAGSPSPQWSSTALPGANPAGDEVLDSVSCPTPKMCLAVGLSYSKSGQAHGQPFGIADEWKGGSWQRVPTPLGQPAPDALSSVSCPSPTYCMAVGDSGYSETGYWVWEAGKWAAHGPGTFQFVSCASATMCMATESINQGDYEGTAFVVWNGSSWTRTSLISTAELDLWSGVSCLPSGSCVAVGNRESAGPVTDIWDGTGWTERAGPVIPAGETSLYTLGVSCVTLDFCMVVGTALDNGAFGEHLAEAWDGSTWQPTPALPSNVDDPYSVSCLSTTWCTAVGYSSTANVTHRAPAEQWNGSQWSEEATARLSLAPFLESVSCPATTFCMATGENENPAGHYSTGPILAEKWATSAL